MEETTGFQQVKDKILAYERVSHSWSKDRVLADIGAAPLGSVTSRKARANGRENRMRKVKGKPSRAMTKEKARANLVIKAKEKFQVAKATQIQRKGNRRASNLRSWTQTHVHTVGRRDTGRRIVVNDKLTFR